MAEDVVRELATKRRVVIDTPEGAPLLRTIVHADGDVVHLATRRGLGDRALVAAHVADVRKRMEPLGSALEKYAGQIGAGLGALIGVAIWGAERGTTGEHPPVTVGSVVAIVLAFVVGTWGGDAVRWVAREALKWRFRFELRG